jgi:hypothetical protein
VTAWSKAVEEGNASKGVRHGEDSRRTFGSATFGSRLGREADQGVRNVVNPMAGCGVQQTRRPSKGWIFGSALCGGNRWSREERQERNAFGTWQSRTEVWATAQAGVDAVTVVSAKGRSMNPMRGVRDVEVDLRVGWDGPDRANRYASEEEWRRSLDPMRSIYDTGGKGQRTTLYEVSVTTRHRLGPGVRSLSSADETTSRGRGSP